MILIADAIALTTGLIGFLLGRLWEMEFGIFHKAYNEAVETLEESLKLNAKLIARNATSFIEDSMNEAAAMIMEEAEAEKAARGRKSSKRK